jgi:hypothetical protein
METVDVGTPNDNAWYGAECYTSLCRLKTDGLTVEELRTLLAVHPSFHDLRVTAVWRIDGMTRS